MAIGRGLRSMNDTSDRLRDQAPAWPPQGPASGPSPYPHDDDQDAPARTSPRPTARLLWRAFRRHWWQAIVLWAAGTAGLMLVAYYKVKPTYDAVAAVRIEQGEQVLFGRGGGGAGDFAEFKETQVARVTSPTVLATALTDHPDLLNCPSLKAVEDAEAEIRQRLAVQVVPKTNLIRVAMSSNSPVEAASIVNAVVDAYVKVAKATSNEEIERRIERLRKDREKRSEEVERRRQEINRLREKLGSADQASVKDRNSLTLDQYRRYSEELTTTEIQRIAARANLDQLRSERSLPGARPQDAAATEQALVEAFYNIPRVLQVQEQLERAEARLAEATRRAVSPSDPARVRAQHDVREALKKRDDLWAQYEPRLRRQMLNGPGDEPADRAVAEAELQLRALESKEQALNAKLRQMTIESQSTGGDALSLEFARDDLNRAIRLLDIVDDNLNQLEFEARSPIARINREFPAKPSNKANSNSRMKVVALSPFLMGMAVLGLLMLVEMKAGRVVDPDDLPGRVRLQVIGVVPPLPRLAHLRPGSGGPIARRDETRARRRLDEFVQSLDHLRVALCARPDPWGRDRHCVLITSACGSEGKTTLAAQLAERCVNAGLLTLLIDADLRNPTLSRMLDASGGPGLINVLRGEAEPEEAIIVIGEAGGFHLLPAGTPRVDPSRLLQGDQLGKLLAQARQSFDMIIVDAPPVLPVPDAMTIGRWTDGAILAVRYDTSRFPLVERANRRLAHVGVPVLGAVVNGVRSPESAYGYGSYSYGPPYEENPTHDGEAPRESAMIDGEEAGATAV